MGCHIRILRIRRALARLECQNAPSALRAPATLVAIYIAARCETSGFAQARRVFVRSRVEMGRSSPPQVGEGVRGEVRLSVNRQRATVGASRAVRAIRPAATDRRVAASSLTASSASLASRATRGSGSGMAANLAARDSAAAGSAATDPAVADRATRGCPAAARPMACWVA